MHFYKHKLGNCGQLAEADRTLYIDKETGKYVRDSSTSLIDFDRTPNNYNLSKNNLTIEEIKNINLHYRHVSSLGKNQNLFCQLRVTLPQDFDIPGHPDFKYLVGVDRIKYLLNHPDAKIYVDDFFKNAMKSLQKHFDIKDDDICSAWVHYDESNPHMHLLFIPVVHEQEKAVELTKSQQQKLERYKELDKLTENPQAFYERIKSDYQTKLENLPPDSKSIKSTQTDLRKLLAKEGNEKEITKYAKEKHRFYKSEIKKMTATHMSETVCVDKKFNRKNLSKMFDKVSEDVTKALGIYVNMRTGESLGFDTQKATKEEKKKAMEAKAETWANKKERDYAQKEADAEVERLYYTNMEANKAQKRLEKIEKDNTSAELNNACLKAENKALKAEKDTKQAETKELQDIQDNIRANLTALSHGYYAQEYTKAVNRGDKQTANNIITTICQRSELCDQYKLENERLSRMNKKLITESNKNKVFTDALNEKAKTYDEIMLMFDDDTLTTRDISEAIKLYALAKNDTETDSILKTCNALDKIDAYNHKSYAQRNKSFMEKAENHNFNRFEEYDTRIRTMLKKSLTYEGRKDIYKGKDNLKSLWADIKSDNRIFWEKKKEKNKTAYEGYISLDKVFTAIVPQLIQTAISAIKSYIEMIKQEQEEQYEI